MVFNSYLFFSDYFDGLCINGCLLAIVVTMSLYRTHFNVSKGLIVNQEKKEKNSEK